jgi:hypothetical protein
MGPIASTKKSSANKILQLSTHILEYDG